MALNSGSYKPSKKGVSKPVKGRPKKKPFEDYDDDETLNGQSATIDGGGEDSEGYDYSDDSGWDDEDYGSEGEEQDQEDDQEDENGENEDGEDDGSGNDENSENQNNDDEDLDDDNQQDNKKDDNKKDDNKGDDKKGDQLDDKKDGEDDKPSPSELADGKNGPPLSPKEKLEAKALGKIPYAGPVIEGLSETDPKKYRFVVKLIKKFIPLALGILFFVCIMSLVSSVAPMAVPFIIIKAIIDLVTAGGAVAPAVDAENFYGVRLTYENTQLANEQLEEGYNQLAFEFLNSVDKIEGLQGLTLELPEDLTADLTSYKTELTNNLVYKICETVLNGQTAQPAEEPEEPTQPPTITVTSENFEECLAQINHFGYTKTDFDNIATDLSGYFVSIVQSSIETADTSDDIVVLEIGATELPAGFDQTVKELWNGENFNPYKISSNKVFVKDIILGGSEETPSVSVNGSLLSYTYLNKANTTLSDKSYAMQVADGDEYKISLVKVDAEGNENIINSATADSSWCKKGSDMKTGNNPESEDFFEDDAYYYDKLLETNSPISLTEDFTCLDKNNMNFLAKDNFSLLEAYKQNQTSAQICFTVTSQDGFTTISETPTCAHAKVTFEYVSGSGSEFVFAELQ